MILELSTRPAREAAAEYLDRQLQKGNRLANMLRTRTGAATATFQVLDASDMPSDKTLEFDHGHAARDNSGSFHWISIGEVSGFAAPIPSAKKQLAAIICDQLNSPLSACLLENSLARPGDSWLRRATSRILSCDGDVYHLLLHDDCNGKIIERAISEAEHVPCLIGACGDAPPKLRTAERDLAGSNELLDFANSVRCIFVSAYDGEGYVVRTEAGAPRFPSVSTL